MTYFCWYCMSPIEKVFVSVLLPAGLFLLKNCRDQWKAWISIQTDDKLGLIDLIQPKNQIWWMRFKLLIHLIFCFFFKSSNQTLNEEMVGHCVANFWDRTMFTKTKWSKHHLDDLFINRIFPPSLLMIM